MRIRCIKDGTNEVVGSFGNNKDMDFFSVAIVFEVSNNGSLINTTQTNIKDVPNIDIGERILNTEYRVFPLLIYHVDNENNPLELMVSTNNSKLVSTRWELFLVMPEQYIGKLPDWQKIPPKRIIEL